MGTGMQSSATPSGQTKAPPAHILKSAEMFLPSVESFWKNFRSVWDGSLQIPISEAFENYLHFEGDKLKLQLGDFINITSLLGFATVSIIDGSPHYSVQPAAVSNVIEMTNLAYSHSQDNKDLDIQPVRSSGLGLNMSEPFSNYDDTEVDFIISRDIHQPPDTYAHCDHSDLPEDVLVKPVVSESVSSNDLVSTQVIQISSGTQENNVLEPSRETLQDHQILVQLNHIPATPDVEQVSQRPASSGVSTASNM